MKSCHYMLSPDCEPGHGYAETASRGAGASSVLRFGRSLTFADLAFCSVPVVAFLAIVSLV